MLQEELDEQLSLALGVKHAWTNFIEKNVTQLGWKTNSIVEDIITDTISNLYFDCRSNTTLQTSLSKASDSNKEQHLSNVRGIVYRYLNYSVKNQQRRWTHYNKSIPFSNLEKEPVIVSKSNYSENIFEQCEDIILESLNKSLKNASGCRKKQLDLAIKILPYRLRGETYVELMERFDVAKATVCKSLKLIAEHFPKDNDG